MNTLTFLENLSWRYATKAFDTTKKLTDDQLTKIRTAIQMAPTSYGLQPFHVVEVTDTETRLKIQDAGYGQAQLVQADRLFVFCSRTDLQNRITSFIELSSGGNAEVKEKMAVYENTMRGALGGLDDTAAKSWSAKQSYIALGFALAACAEMQVDSCPMEGFDASAVSQILGLPAHISAQAILAVGYRASTDTPRPKVRFAVEELISIK
jgi:nitroreductase